MDIVYFKVFCSSETADCCIYESFSLWGMILFNTEFTIYIICKYGLQIKYLLGIIFHSLDFSLISFAV